MTRSLHRHRKLKSIFITDLVGSDNKRNECLVFLMKSEYNTLTSLIGLWN